MLRPIPASILTHSATLRQCTGVDVWQNPTFADTELRRICVQPEHNTYIYNDNTSVTLSSIAFVDARLSSPRGFDFQAAQETSEANGAPLELIFNGRRYTVLEIDTLYDDTGKYHHTELWLK